MSDDSRFYETFKFLMDGMGVPCPETLFGTFTSALGTVGGILKALQTAPGSSMAEVLLTFPRAAGQAGKLIAYSEIVAVLGGISAAGYVGVCLGAMITAAWDTWGVAAVGKFRVLTIECEKTHGKSMDLIIQQSMKTRPPKAGSLMLMLAIDRARFMSL